jgi:hypothetical protein
MYRQPRGKLDKSVRWVSRIESTARKRDRIGRTRARANPRLQAQIIVFAH